MSPITNAEAYKQLTENASNDRSRTIRTMCIASSSTPIQPPHPIRRYEVFGGSDLVVKPK